MNGTVDGKKGDGFLLNTVQVTLAPIPRGLSSAPESAEDQTETDVVVYKSDNQDDADLGYIKNEGENEFINPVQGDEEKAKKSPVIEP
ncbi:MAG TPA: hypothetical protein VF490_16685 [Chryseosolibacter sp.]